MTAKLFKAGAIIAACFLFGDLLFLRISEDGWAKGLGALLLKMSVLIPCALGYWAGRSRGRWAVALVALFVFVSASRSLEGGDWQSARHLTISVLLTALTSVLMFVGYAVRNAQQIAEAAPGAHGQQPAPDAGPPARTEPGAGSELEANWVGTACVAALAWTTLWTADLTRGVSLLAWPILGIILGNFLGPQAGLAVGAWAGWSKEWSDAPNRFQVVAGATFAGIAALLPAAYISKRGWLEWLTPFAPLTFMLALSPWIGVCIARAGAAWIGAFALGLSGLAFMRGWSLDGQHLSVIGVAVFQASLYTALVLAMNHRQRSCGLPAAR